MQINEDDIKQIMRLYLAEPQTEDEQLAHSSALVAYEDKYGWELMDMVESLIDEMPSHVIDNFEE